MDKELILKYKTEFDHWLNGGNVQVCYIKDNEPKWLTDEECIEYEGYDNFSHIIQNLLGTDDVLIVIDDPYTEFRKALAEGGTVQYNFGNYGINRKDFPNIWKDLDPSIEILADRACPENYRIKPEEPKFKVGDWITDGIEVWQHKENCRVKNQTNWNLWRPQLGEWCWVGYKLMKFNKLIKEDYSTTFEFIFPDRDADGYKIKEHILERHLQVVEPFIGQLPSYLKE